MIAATGTATGSGLLSFLVVVFAIGAYFLPTILAFVRKVPDAGSVLILNLFLGCTIIGWIVALAMAFRDRPQPPPVRFINGYTPTPDNVPGPAPGWYPDPYGQATFRYFDGRIWTGNVK
jgi:hypothetical protein